MEPNLLAQVSRRRHRPFFSSGERTRNMVNQLIVEIIVIAALIGSLM